MEKWFAYHSEEGFQRFETADEAREVAHAWLDAERDEAVDEWRDDVDEICWGEIHQQVEEIVKQRRMDGDVIITDYELAYKKPLPTWGVRSGSKQIGE